MPRSRFLSRAAAVLFLALPVAMLAAGSASADLVSADGFTTLSAGSGVGAGTPYQSGQTITVTITMNSALASAALTAYGNSNVVAEECATTNDLAPTSLTGTTCDSETVEDGISVNSNGSSSFTFEVYSLPDHPTLLEAPSHLPACGLQPNDCVIYIGVNPTLITAPHLFSAPFQVATDAGDTAANPGDGTPESPLPILLPLIAAALVGGAALEVTRRRRRAA
jgi:hypothetical protein